MKKVVNTTSWLAATIAAATVAVVIHHSVGWLLSITDYGPCTCTTSEVSGRVILRYTGYPVIYGANVTITTTTTTTTTVATGVATTICFQCLEVFLVVVFLLLSNFGLRSQGSKYNVAIIVISCSSYCCCYSCCYCCCCCCCCCYCHICAVDHRVARISQYDPSTNLRGGTCTWSIVRYAQQPSH